MTRRTSDGQRIQTQYWAKPIPIRQFDWCAATENYDGAEDSVTRNQIGYGRTEDEAITDLLERLEE